MLMRNSGDYEILKNIYSNNKYSHSNSRKYIPKIESFFLQIQERTNILILNKNSKIKLIIF